MVRTIVSLGHYQRQGALRRFRAFDQSSAHRDTRFEEWRRSILLRALMAGLRT